MIFVTDDMSVRSKQEWRLVLLPAFAIGLIFIGLMPVIAMIWYGWPHPLFAPVDQHNLACVFAMETMGYVVIYEWLHLSYHLPPESFVGRLGFAGEVAGHHQRGAELAHGAADRERHAADEPALRHRQLHAHDRAQRGVT